VPETTVKTPPVIDVPPSVADPLVKIVDRSFFPYVIVAVVGHVTVGVIVLIVIDSLVLATTVS
jgi:hypothetical protein